MYIELKNKIDKLFVMTKAKYLDFRILYNGKFIDLIEEDYLLPNGVIINRERIIKNKGKSSVIVIAITKDNKYLLVSQNRIDNMLTLEFPSGYIEEGENAKEGAIRELREETGYVCCDIKLLDSYYSSLGIDSSLVYIFVAYDCERLYDQNLGNMEYINYEEFSLEEVWELINNNIINGVGNKLAFYEYLNLYNKDYVKSRIMNR